MESTHLLTVCCRGGGCFAHVNCNASLSMSLSFSAMEIGIENTNVSETVNIAPKCMRNHIRNK